MSDNVTTGAIAGAVGLVSAFLTWLGQAAVNRATVETAINNTVKELLEQLRQELRVAIRERDDARSDEEEIRRTLRIVQAHCECPDHVQLFQPAAKHLSKEPSA